MISDLWVYELGDVILLNLPGETTAAVLAKLDQFIFSEDVQLGDVSETFAQVAVVGPEAARVVEALLDAPAARRWHRCPNTATCAATSVEARPSSRA